EGHGGRGGALEVEEVSRTEVRVAVLVAGVDRSEVDGCLHLGLQGIGGDLDRTRVVAESASDLRDHHVTHDEADGGVHGIDVPRAGGESGEIGHGSCSSGCCRGEVVASSTVADSVAMSTIDVAWNWLL